MCTAGGVWLDGQRVLFKTRDPITWMRWDDQIALFDGPDDVYRKRIVQNPDTHADGFYGGMNEAGVSLVFTHVMSNLNQTSLVRKPYIRLILNAGTAAEAVDIITSFLPRVCGNIFVADATECYSIEGSFEEYHVEKVEKALAKTNHYIHLPYPNLDYATDPTYETWSLTRKQRVDEVVGNLCSLEDIRNLLRDRKNAETLNAICCIPGEDPCYTHSAFVFETKQLKAHYSQGNPLQNDFVEYTFPAERARVEPSLTGDHVTIPMEKPSSVL